MIGSAIERLFAEFMAFRFAVFTLAPLQALAMRHTIYRWQEVAVEHFSDGLEVCVLRFRAVAGGLHNRGHQSGNGVFRGFDVDWQPELTKRCRGHRSDGGAGHALIA